jgi:hypothetical protein
MEKEGAPCIGTRVLAAKNDVVMGPIDSNNNPQV